MVVVNSDSTNYVVEGGFFLLDIYTKNSVCSLKRAIIVAGVFFPFFLSFFISVFP